MARIWHALLYSLDGLVAAYRGESAFRQELAVAAVLVPTACVVPGSLTQRALLIATVALVLVAELLNSSLEATVDRISLDDHELARRAKDTASAAVFVSLLTCGLVWVLILIDIFT